MHVRLRYRVGELAAEVTRSLHKKMHKNRPHSKMGRYRDKRTSQLPWGE
jgi:hypothetical protein